MVPWCWQQLADSYFNCVDVVEVLLINWFEGLLLAQIRFKLQRCWLFSFGEIFDFFWWLESCDLWAVTIVGSRTESKASWYFYWRLIICFDSDNRPSVGDVLSELLGSLRLSHSPFIGNLSALLKPNTDQILL